MKSFSTSTLIGEVYVILYTVGGGGFSSAEVWTFWKYRDQVALAEKCGNGKILENYLYNQESSNYPGFFFGGGGKLDILQIYGKFFGEFLLSPLFGLVII